jgi:hypothetical protein
MRFRYKEGIMEKNENQKIEMTMKDYEILKTYSTSIFPGIRYNLLSIVFATIGIVISGTMIAVANAKLSDLVASIIAMLWILFVPAFCIAILYMWLGEEERMMRIGEYLKGLEITINERLGEKILNWETFKRNKSIIYPEILIIAILLGLSLGFSLAGLYLIKIHFIMTFNFIAALIIDLVVHIVILLSTYFFVKKRIVSIEKLK